MWWEIGPILSKKWIDVHIQEKGNISLNIIISWLLIHNLGLQVRVFETHCGSLTQYGMKHMRAFANICNSGVSETSMENACVAACGGYHAGQLHPSNTGYSAWFWAVHTETGWLCNTLNCILTTGFCCLVQICSLYNLSSTCSVYKRNSTLLNKISTVLVSMVRAAWWTPFLQIQDIFLILGFSLTVAILSIN